MRKIVLILFCVSFFGAIAQNKGVPVYTDTVELVDFLKSAMMGDKRYYTGDYSGDSLYLLSNCVLKMPEGYNLDLREELLPFAKLDSNSKIVFQKPIRIEKVLIERVLGVGLDLSFDSMAFNSIEFSRVFAPGHGFVFSNCFFLEPLSLSLINTYRIGLSDNYFKKGAGIRYTEGKITSNIFLYRNTSLGEFSLKGNKSNYDIKDNSFIVKGNVWGNDTLLVDNLHKVNCLNEQLDEKHEGYKKLLGRQLFSFDSLSFDSLTFDDTTYLKSPLKITIRQNNASLPFNFNFINNVIGDSNSYNTLKISGLFTDFNMKDNDIYGNFDLGTSKILNSFLIRDNYISEGIFFENILFSELKNYISWNQINGFKIQGFIDDFRNLDDFDGRYSKYTLTTSALNTEIYKNEYSYNKLYESYNNLYKLYKLNGNIESANGCFAEMKQVETFRWKYLFEQNKTFESLFRWQLNSFLSYFTDYGTNPAKAVIKSWWVILLFSIFYLFYPSDWDVSNKSQLLSKLRDLVSKNREKSILATVSFLIYSAFIHVLNAVTLSLNAFTTLGFGDIPTHGASRYVTIVQGFIGWFLLTIFSVSLINQVLG